MHGQTLRRGGTEEVDDKIREASYATLRMVALIEESRHKVTEDTRRAFCDHVKQAQEWALKSPNAQNR